MDAAPRPVDGWTRSEHYRALQRRLLAEVDHWASGWPHRDRLPTADPEDVD